MNASTILDIIMDIYPPDNFDYDENNEQEYSGYRSDVHVFPCVKLAERD